MHFNGFIWSQNASWNKIEANLWLYLEANLWLYLWLTFLSDWEEFCLHSLSFSSSLSFPSRRTFKYLGLALYQFFSNSSQIKQTNTFPDPQDPPLSAHQEVLNLHPRRANCLFHWASMELLKEEDIGTFSVSSWPSIESNYYEKEILMNISSNISKVLCSTPQNVLK